MTIGNPASNNRKQINGNGITSSIPIDWSFWDQTDLKVIHTDASGTDTVWTYGASPGSWAYAGGNGSTGTVTFTAADCASGERLTVIPAEKLDQPVDLNSGNISQSAMETSVDKLAARLQREAERVDRAPRMKESTLSDTPTFPEPSAGKVIAWNDAGDNLENGPSVGDIADAAANATIATNKASEAQGYAEDAAEARDEAEAVLSQINFVIFDTVADMVADTNLTVGEKVQTLGYLSVGDGGGNDYHIVAAATGTADGGAYIDLAGASLQAEGIFDNHIIHAEKFGAVTGREASAAIQAASDFALANTTTLGDSINAKTRSKLVLSSGVEIKDPLFIGSSSTNLDVDFSGAVISCVSGGTLTSSTPAITLEGTSSTRHMCRVHCDKICPGYLIQNSANSHTYGCFARRFVTYGVKESGTNRGHILHMPVGGEWESTDSEANTDANYTGTALVLDGWDSVVNGMHMGFSGVAIELTENAGNVWIIQPHPYCNNPNDQATYPRQDPIAILNNSPNRNHVLSPYIDSGYIVDNEGSLQVSGDLRFFISSEAAAGLTEPYVRIREDGGTQGTDRTNIQNMYGSVGYFDTDYTTLLTDEIQQWSDLEGYAIDGRSEDLYRQKLIIYNNESSTVAHVMEQVREGRELRKKQFFADDHVFTETTSVVSDAIQREYKARTLRVNGEDISEDASLLLLGNATDGIRSDHSTGSFHFLVDGGIKWLINGTSFALAPGSDNSYSLCAASLRSSVVYSATSSISTSDATLKTLRDGSTAVGSDYGVSQLTSDELAAFLDIGRQIGIYKFKDAVAAKGADAARLHSGLTVQKAIAILESYDLDPMSYAAICYDEWEAKEATEETPAIEAGSRYSFRESELHSLVLRAYLQRQDDLEDRIAALEEA